MTPSANGAELAALVDPAHTALVTQECQTAIIGKLSPIAPLVDAAAPIKPVIADLARSARAAGVAVVHCTFVRRPDGVAANRNARLFRAMARAGIDLAPGSEGAAVDPGIEPAPDDLVLSRHHGVGPMGGTDLDPVLRNLGVSTIVGVGVSLNVGMLSFALDAVNAGYTFVLPRDAVAGTPPDYAAAVIDHTLSLLVTLVHAADVTAAWSGSAPDGDR